MSIISSKRKYARALKEVEKAIGAELNSLEENSSDFEPSSGIANILFELIKQNIALQTAIEVSHEVDTNSNI